LKILIHGQEMDTLAGHVDLTQMFVVNTKSPQSGQITTALPARPPQPAGTPSATSTPFK